MAEQLVNTCMFIGEYTHNVDNKGRLAIPAKFRRNLKRGSVVTRGLDNCLAVYPGQEWKKLATKLSTLPISQSNTRAFSRLMLAGAADASPDKQGRIMLPEYLRSYAGIQKNVVIAGLYNRVEIWDANIWAHYKCATEKDSGAIAEQLGGLGV
jgi:MraZ protein